MKKNWNYRRPARAGLTLIELVVVLVILVAVASLVLPRVSGIGAQANNASSATIIGDVSKAIGTFENRYFQSPNGWDGILTSASGTFYSQLHPKLQTNQASAKAFDPILTTVTLTDTQLASLNKAGITFLHYNSTSNTGLPSDTGTNFKFLATGDQVAGLFVPTTSTTPAWTGHGSTFPDRAFNLNPFNTGATDSFVVFGVGQPCSLRGATIQESPIVNSANPSQYYARVLAVYHIPGPTSTTVFPAQFVGTFSPDGTSLNDNVSNFSTADKPLGLN